MLRKLGHTLSQKFLIILWYNFDNDVVFYKISPHDHLEI